MHRSTRLFDFNIITDASKLKHLQSTTYDSDPEPDEDGRVPFSDKETFVVQAFGIDEKGDTTSVWIHGFEPFVYIKVGDNWTEGTKRSFIDEVKKAVKFPASQGIRDRQCRLIEKKTLYGFDNDKLHKFVLIKCSSIKTLNRVKDLWYTKYTPGGSRKLKDGYRFGGSLTRLYEAQVPPLLRLFHVKKI